MKANPSDEASAGYRLQRLEPSVVSYRVACKTHANHAELLLPLQPVTMLSVIDVLAVLAVLDAASMPAGRVHTVADIAADPYYLARGMLQTVLRADGSRLAVPEIVPKLSRAPGGHRHNAPTRQRANTGARQQGRSGCIESAEIAPGPD